MRRLRIWWLGGLVGFIVLSLGAWWSFDRPEAAEGGVIPSTTRSEEIAGGANTNDSRHEHAGDVETIDSVSEFRDRLAELSSVEQRAFLEAFLDSGRDLETGRSFHVGDEGWLTSAPTLRVAALDALGRADPMAAARYSRRILDTSDSADEWAIALRNYARSLGSGQHDSYFANRVEELLTRDEWLASPTGGFLEAFDAVVFSGAPEFIGQLAHLQQEAEHAAVRRAALISLERLAARESLEVARVLAKNPDVLAERPAWRASLFARVDPRNDDGQTLLEGYWQQSLSDVERTTFLESFPNGNAFAGHFLLTAPEPFSPARQARIDATALDLLRQWQARGDLSAEALSDAIQRLEQFVRSARAAGYLASTAVP